MENSKQCLHTFRSVYYGSEWEVECEKCDKNVRDLYSNDDALLIVENMLTENKNSRNEKSLNFSTRTLRINLNNL